MSEYERADDPSDSSRWVLEQKLAHETLFADVSVRWLRTPGDLHAPLVFTGDLWDYMDWSSSPLCPVLRRATPNEVEWLRKEWA